MQVLRSDSDVAACVRLGFSSLSVELQLVGRDCDPVLWVVCSQSRKARMYFFGCSRERLWREDRAQYSSLSTSGRLSMERKSTRTRERCGEDWDNEVPCNRYCGLQEGGGSSEPCPGDNGRGLNDRPTGMIDWPASVPLQFSCSPQIMQTPSLVGSSIGNDTYHTTYETIPLEQLLMRDDLKV